MSSLNTLPPDARALHTRVVAAILTETITVRFPHEGDLVVKHTATRVARYCRSDQELEAMLCGDVSAWAAAPRGEDPRTSTVVIALFGAACVES